MLTIRHVDTCLSCFVLDHCNGETEALVGVSVDGETTYSDLRESLLDEVNWNCDKLPTRYTPKDVAAAVADLFEFVSDMEMQFDSSLAMPDREDDFDGESCFAWFRLSWEPGE